MWIVCDRRQLSPPKICQGGINKITKRTHFEFFDLPATRESYAPDVSNLSQKRTHFNSCLDRLWGASQNLSNGEKCGKAAEQRKKVAHGESRGKRGWNLPSPGGAKENSPSQYSFAALRLFFLSFHSHGARRGLPSVATPWLKYRSNFEMRLRWCRPEQNYFPVPAPAICIASSTYSDPEPPGGWGQNIEHPTTNMLCRNDHDGEKSVKIPEAVRLPLRREMGERAGVRWCSGLRGIMVSTEHIQHPMSGGAPEFLLVKLPLFCSLDIT